jgi:hypothetical protein
MASDLTIYWRDWTETHLAGYQQDQGRSNHCAKFAAASVLNLLYGSSLSGDTLVNWVDNQIFKGTGIYTILGNNHGSFVFQTANLVRKLGRLNGLYPIIRCGFGTRSDLKSRLRDINTLSLVSITYFQGHEPVVSEGTNTHSSLGSNPVLGGHLMILAAYDTNHKNSADVTTPWGFLSSWPSKKALYWMSEADFKSSWGKLSYFNMITVQRTD